MYVLVKVKGMIIYIESELKFAPIDYDHLIFLPAPIFLSSIFPHLHFLTIVKFFLTSNSEICSRKI